MLVSLTVGKVDAGVAVLLTEDKRLIEFPSILLPADISSGSIVDVNVSRNYAAEKAAHQSFSTLQTEILSAFGSSSPSAPVLRCRNATQTSVVLEWDPISLATAKLRSLSLYRNGSKAGNIPRPFEMTSTKISGLAVDTQYSFFLVLRTSAGTYNSEKLVVRTHKMTDLTGITVTPGIMATELRESLVRTAERIGAKVIDQVRIDTTHFVCIEGRGVAWEKAVEMNVPVVVPDWIKGCEREGRIVGVRGYYLNADPKLRQVGPGQISRDSLPVSSPGALGTPTTEVTPPTPERVVPERDLPLRSPPAQPPTPPAKDYMPEEDDLQTNNNVKASRPVTTQDEETPDDEDEQSSTADGEEGSGNEIAEHTRQDNMSNEGERDDDTEGEEEEKENKISTRKSRPEEVQEFDEVTL